MWKIVKMYIPSLSPRVVDILDCSYQFILFRQLVSYPFDRTSSYLQWHLGMIWECTCCCDFCNWTSSIRVIAPFQPLKCYILYVSSIVLCRQHFWCLLTELVHLPRKISLWQSHQKWTGHICYSLYNSKPCLEHPPLVPIQITSLERLVCYL